VIRPGPALDMIARETIDMLTLSTHVDVELAAEQRQRPRNLPSLARVRGGASLLAAIGKPEDLRDVGAGYGLSETFTITSSVQGLSEEQRRRTHGRVFPGVEVRIVDAVTGGELPQGESGEVAIRGVTLMLGYLGVPREEAFDSQGYYRPGDIGHIDADGLLHWEGRGREMIRSRGANVAPVEIELVLAQWGGIKHGRAVGVPHPAFGEAIVVCGVRPAGAQTSEADVIAALKTRLAAYKLPQRVLFFDEAELDLTGTRKVKGDALRRLAARRLADAGVDAAWAEHLRRELA
jgi:acyl-CoA synthetase (AMP-forming)/AMP-acid ligase II